jgi:hypothetical protein
MTEAGSDDSEDYETIPIVEQPGPRGDEDAAEVDADSEVDFDDETDDDQLPLDELAARESGAELDDPERLTARDRDD